MRVTRLPKFKLSVVLPKVMWRRFKHGADLAGSVGMIGEAEFTWKPSFCFFMSC